MSENENAEETTTAPVEIDVTTLTPDQLKRLTNDQVEFVSGLAPHRLGDHITNVVNAALRPSEELTEAIMGALIREPYIYVSPEIEIFPGLKVSYQTLLDFQQEDIFEQNVKNRSTVMAQMTNATHFSKLLLSHAVNTINGEAFGGRQIGRAFVETYESDPTKALETLAAVRALRMKSLAKKPSTIIQAMYHGYLAFQTIVDAVAHFRPSGDKAKDAARIEQIATDLGKSRGPERAGPAPT